MSNLPETRSFSLGDVFRQGIRACGKVLIVVGIFSIALNLLMLSVPLYMMQVYDRVLSSHSVETLVMLSLLAAGALLLVGILEGVRLVLLARAAARLESRIGEATLSASINGANKSGADAQGLRDLSQIRQFVASPLICAWFDLPVSPIYLALLFFVHPHLGWIATAGAIVILIASVANQMLTTKHLKEAGQQGMAAASTAQSQIRNAETLRAMGMFPNTRSLWKQSYAASLAASDQANTRNSIATGFIRFVRLLLQIAMLGYGAWLVLQNNLSPGIIIAASIISARALAPLDQLVGGWRTMVSTAQAYGRLKKLLADESEVSNLLDLPKPRGDLEIEKLVYVPHPDSPPILNTLDFAVPAGSVVGVIGPSGAGKSTLARLLVGILEPTEGTVRLGGDELQHWDPEKLGPHIGYMSQDIELFPGTVAENIARLDPDFEMDDVLSAAQLANGHEMIQHLPNGYETQIGPVGVKISGGQKQLIALARAFYKKPVLVVLDEPNAHLDSTGEVGLRDALTKASRTGITSVVVTQRTSILPVLDRLLVLKNGKIESYGPPEEVLRPANQQQNQSSKRQSANADKSKITARFG